MLAKSKIIFHEGAIPIKLHEEWHFGVFELEVAKTDMTELPQEIHLMLDKSGSMDEICSDRSSKIDQIKHVTKNILHFVKGKRVSVGVSAFNSTVSTIFPKTEVREDNIDELIASVKRMYAENETNIGDALQSMRSFSNTKERHNIFMTDGDATVGEKDPAKLLKFVDQTAASNTFIGFGFDHNPDMFLALNNAENSNYYFIDKIEKSGLAYGEILHNILFKCIQNVKITIYNGLIYDWKTNEWLNEITIGSIASEAKKTFQLVAPDMSKVIIIVSGIPSNYDEIAYGGALYDEGTINIVNVECSDSSATDDYPSMEFSRSFMHTGHMEDLMKMFYRQKTQEYLYLAKTKACEKRLVKDLKKDIAEFTKEMKEYMKTHDLVDDLLMKNLCDDMVVVYKTFGTRFGMMYSSARQTSQGNERLFNVCDTPTRSGNHYEPHENESQMWEHTLSEESPYYSEQLAGVMRDVSVPQTSIDLTVKTNDYTLPDGSLFFPQLFRANTSSEPLTLEDLTDGLSPKDLTPKEHSAEVHQFSRSTSV